MKILSYQILNEKYLHTKTTQSHQIHTAAKEDLIIMLPSRLWAPFAAAEPHLALPEGRARAHRHSYLLWTVNRQANDCQCSLYVSLCLSAYLCEWKGVRQCVWVCVWVSVRISGCVFMAFFAARRLFN